MTLSDKKSNRHHPNSHPNAQNAGSHEAASAKPRLKSPNPSKTVLKQKNNNNKQPSLNNLFGIQWVPTMGSNQRRRNHQNTPSLMLSPSLPKDQKDPKDPGKPTVGQPKDNHIEDDMKKMKEKYKDVKQLKAEGNDDEVFECVNDANPVFTATLLRKGKGMKWKDKEEEKDTIRKKTANAEAAEKAEKADSDEKERKRMSGETIRVSKTPSNIDKAAELRNKIEKLEQENEELKKKLLEVQKVLKKRNGADKEEPSQDVPEEIQNLAIRTLTIMKKNQILDTVLDSKHNRMLYNFFRECEKPTEEVAMTVENAITRGLKYIINCGDQISDVIDNQLRDFICNTAMAKKVLLKTMFERPDLVPDMWGGGAMLVKLRKEKLEANEEAGLKKKKSAE